MNARVIFGGMILAAGLANFGGLGAPARADEQIAALPGQQGGDPVPDTKEAADLIKRGRFEDAIISSRRALSRDERYVPAMLVMAKAYYNLKKYELATSIIGLAKDLDANNAEAYNILGFISLARNDIGGATANFKKATELNPEYGIAWNTLCAQYLLAKSYDPAVEACEHATKLLPNFDKAWLNMGSAYRGKGQVDEAQKAYEHALQINPNLAEVYFNLGILYLDAPQMPNLDIPGKETKGIDYLSKYKNLAASRLGGDDPTDGYVDDARKVIEREQKRIEREAKRKAREAQKKASQPATPPPAAAPAPAAPAPDAPPPAAAPAPAPAAPSTEPAPAFMDPAATPAPQGNP